MANCYDIIRAVAIVLGFGYCARQDRKTWLWAESVLWGYYTAATFVCPETFVSVVGGVMKKIFSIVLQYEEKTAA